MGIDSVSTANYDAVIADLTAKRDEFDRTISMLKALSPQERAASERPIQPAANVENERKEPISSNTGTNNGIGDACARILHTHAGEGLSTRQVTDLLLKSGFPIHSKTPMNNVWGALDHRSKTAKDIEKVGRQWRRVSKGNAKDGASRNAQMNGPSSH